MSKKTSCLLNHWKTKGHGLMVMRLYERKRVLTQWLKLCKKENSIIIMAPSKALSPLSYRKKQHCDDYMTVHVYKNRYKQLVKVRMRHNEGLPYSINSNFSTG